MVDSASKRLLPAGALILMVALAMPARAADPAKAAGFFEDGLSRYHDGDLAGAVIQLKNALQQNPDMLTAHVLLGRALLEQSEFPAAEAAFDKALELGVSPREIAAPRGRLLMALGRAKQLLREISADGLMGDALVEVLTLRAKAMAMEGDVSGARDTFAAAIATDPSSVVPYVELVPFLIQQGDLEAANERVAALLRVAPEDARTWNLSASLHHVRGRLDEALLDYDKALSIDPTHVDARVARASLLVDLKRDEDARKDLDYLAEHAKREPRSAYLRALLAGRAGDEAAAGEALTEVAALVDSLPVEYVAANEQLMMLGGLSHHGLQAREKAKKYLDALLRRYPHNLGARKLLAAIYLDENDSARALSAVEPVLEMSPNDPQGNLLAGRAYLGFRRFVQAREHLERAVKFLGEGADARFALGLSQIGTGESAAGLENLERAAKARPGDVTIGMTIVSAFMQQGKRDEALARATALAKAAPDSLPALNLLGSVRAATGDAAGARSAFEAALSRDPAFAPAALNLARVDVANGQSAAAKQRLEGLLAKDPEDPRVIFELGRLSMQAGAMDEAINQLRKAVELQPDQAAPGLALVEALSRAGQHPAALSAAKEVGLRHPDDLAVQAVLGQAYLATGQRAEARQTFKGMTRLAEFDPVAQIRIGRLMLGAGYPDEADYNVRKALTARPDYVPAHALAVDAALMRGDLAGARSALEALRKAAPEAVEVIRFEGTLALRAGDFETASRRFEQLYRKAPGPLAALNLSAVYQQADQPAKAQKVLETALAKAESVPLLDALARVHEQQAQWHAARDAYRKALYLNPNDPGLHRRLALVLLALDDSGALAAADKARALAPNDPKIIDTVGWVRFRTGDTDGALALLRDARLRAPADAEIRYHLGEVLASSGRQGEAKAELAAALATDTPFPGRDRARELAASLGHRAP